MDDVRGDFLESILSPLQGQELSQRALKSSLRTPGNIKVSRGEIARTPPPPYERGSAPFRAPQTRAFSTRKTSLMLQGRTTFHKATTALLCCLSLKYVFIFLVKKVQVGKDQEKAQSERDSHSKNRGGKNQTNNQALIP